MLTDGHFPFIIECSNDTLKCSSQINTLKKKIYVSHALSEKCMGDYCCQCFATRDDFFKMQTEDC